MLNYTIQDILIKRAEASKIVLKKEEKGKVTSTTAPNRDFKSSYILWLTVIGSSGCSKTTIINLLYNNSFSITEEEFIDVKPSTTMK